ncbi:DegT/DnrJ/EryC1/StrS family aminotransferase [Halopiger djelfimassiliensis]|uniref:DegT/DnrJ/EryC1/StrS family aminotransferase n=1 Tax=Halopiger djelfimassiliensis TaxID=1293047 RepID=UPI000677FC0A|nr:DegT/DnrJ/EryC1/StrS family aminotransferase [Halopiger djelfimassiliensis]
MIRNAPSLFDAPKPPSAGESTGIKPFLEGHARAVTVYGSGKVALRDGLSGLVEPGQNVLVPAYLPDAVVEPLSELGLESRYYAVEPTLAPDFVDLERRIDDDSVAVVSVDYFGFPQPGLEELSAIAADYDCYHVDDNAHAPLSVDGETLLGTRGHLGVTSLWKLLPIPNGALLYLNAEGAIDAYDPSPLAGVRDRIDAADCRFVLAAAARKLFDTDGTLWRALESVVADEGSSPAVGGPAERYEDGKTRMSKLAATVVENADPAAVRTRRRENYRTWRRLLAPRDDLEIVFESLPPGICPQTFPVRAERPTAFLEELDDCGVGAHTWPRLSRAVVDDSAYETATRLSREIVTLPVHQHVTPSAIEAVGDRLSR